MITHLKTFGVVEFLGKYVRSDKVDGKYFHGEPIYKWKEEA